MKTSKLKNIILSIFISFAFQYNANAVCTYASPLEGSEFQIGNMISWSTAAEYESKLFIIEKSENGIDFETVGKLEAAGHSTAIKEYQFLDINAKEVFTMYRLKLVNSDGSHSFSRIAIVQKTMENNFMIVAMSSTIVNETFEAQIDATKKMEASYQLLNLKNEVLIEDKISLINGLSNLIIDTKDLKEGTYKLNIQVDSEVERLVLRKTLDAVQKDNFASKSK